MEPPKATIVFTSKVVGLEEKKDKVWVKGLALEAEFTYPSLGWFVGLEGSYEWLHVGPDKPNVSIGDIATVRITFHAKA
jgi:hypothetical protein